MEFYRTRVDFGSLHESAQIVLCDSQTSGGLLVALPVQEANDFTARLNTTLATDEIPMWASEIGQVVSSDIARIVVR